MKTTIFASDRVALSRRRTTHEGHVIAPGTIARTGVQEYRAFELGLEQHFGGDAMRMVRLLRPESEVFDAASMASFNGCPITIDHPDELVTNDNREQLAKGEVQAVQRSGQYMQATLVIKSRDAIAALNQGKRELSNGYTFTLDLTAGSTQAGQAYDGVQRNIRGNHIALVDAARCGSACRVFDSATTNHPPKGLKTMTEALRKVVVDGIPVEVSETAAAAIDKLTQARDAAVAALKAAPTQAALDALTTEVKALKDAASAKEQEIKALQKDVITPAARDALVAQWAKLIGDAKRLVPSLVSDGKTCHALRKEVLGSVQNPSAQAVIKAVIGDKAVTELDETTACTAFAAIAAMTPPGSASDGAVGAALSASASDGAARAHAIDARMLWARNLNTVCQE